MNVCKGIYYGCLGCLSDTLALRITGLRKLGYWMNLEKPRTINEKINWRKLYQKDPRFDVLSDKQDVKAYIEKVVGIGHVVPTLWCDPDFSDISWETLTYPLVIKCTHATGDAFFVHSLKEVDLEKIRKHFIKYWDNKNLKRFSRSTHESKNKRYIIEPLLGSGEKPPADYKFYCYHGRVHFLHVDEERFGGQRRRFYTREWGPLDIKKSWPLADIKSRPQQYDQMIEVVEKLSSDFDFVRVDLYLLDEHIYCGELTFTPGAGFSPFEPRKWDLAFGEPWKIEA